MGYRLTRFIISSVFVNRR